MCCISVSLLKVSTTRGCVLCLHFFAAKRPALDPPPPMAPPAKKPKPMERKSTPARVLKSTTVQNRVDKYGKYGLYENGGLLFCKPCGKKVDWNREDSIKDHIVAEKHENAVRVHTTCGAPYVLVAGYEQRQEARAEKAATLAARSAAKRTGVLPFFWVPASALPLSPLGQYQSSP